jgi:hypothetical protein
MNINRVIVDQRWEGKSVLNINMYVVTKIIFILFLEMKIYRTEYVTGDRDPLKFITALSTLKFNFDIPFSIRTEKEAHIFLCDGEDPHESNCYWFMLQAFSGDETAIRKCSKGFVPKISNKWPQGECKMKQANIVVCIHLFMFYTDL